MSGAGLPHLTWHKLPAGALRSREGRFSIYVWPNGYALFDGHLRLTVKRKQSEAKLYALHVLTREVERERRRSSA